MSKELQKKESSIPAMTVNDWGYQNVSSKDIVIPKILVMQGLSELVSAEKAKMGDFVDSMTEEVIGNYDKKPIQFIPFHMESVWIISKKGKTDKDFSFDKIEKVTPQNENMLYQEVVGDTEYKREYTRNFYVLKPDDMSLPYIISFKGMSAKSGKILATQMFVRNAAAGKVPPAMVMELFGNKDKNDKGTFITLATRSVRESSNEEISSAFNWYKTVTGGGVKAHEAEEGEYYEGTQQEMF